MSCAGRAVDDDSEQPDEYIVVDGRNEVQYLTEATDTLAFIDGGMVSADFNGMHETAELGLRVQYHDPDHPDAPTRFSIENKLETEDGTSVMIGADLSAEQARQLAQLILSELEAVPDE